MDNVLVVRNITTEGTNINYKTSLYVDNTLKALLVTYLVYKTFLNLRK